MNKQQSTYLLRDCDAVLIPQGTPILLMQGTEIVVTQALGGAYTLYSNGHLLRISAENADALGEDCIKQYQEQTGPNSPVVPDPNLSLEEKVWMQLKTCYDPEIPVNIVDLGLIYQCAISPAAATGFNVCVTMTLTAAGCGMGPILVEDVKQKLVILPEVAHVDVDLVFDPPWNQDRMTPEARLQLGVL